MHKDNEPVDEGTTSAANHATLCRELPGDTSLEPLLEIIRQKHGDSILAIMVYGSWLRGKRDTMLDFYVLLDNYSTLDSSWQGWLCHLLPPNVYHICHPADSVAATPELRAKYALLTHDRFCHAVKADFHSYFWARFAQPCRILYVRDEAARDKLDTAFDDAAATFIQKVLPVMGERFSSYDLWIRGFTLTYQCELRTEGIDRGSSIYAFNRVIYDRILQDFSDRNDQVSNADTTGGYLNHCSFVAQKLSVVTWGTRRIQGKLLSALRLLKAAFTFSDPLEYLLWKIERHSGLYIEPTPRQLKHPLIFAWPLLWKLHKQGAFK
jgi:hypothetical protein